MSDRNGERFAFVDRDVMLSVRMIGSEPGKGCSSYPDGILET